MSAEIDERRRALSVVAGMAIAVAPLSLLRAAIARSSEPSPQSPIVALPTMERATAWLNSPPLTADALRGKTVLINFWTYSCINWLRSLPYMRAWTKKYRDQGLVVIGIHSPEFAFEKDVANVTRAARAMNVDYPIAIDSEHALWRAFRNQYWPAIYLADGHGRVRHYSVGEGNYQQTEKRIQQLLTEAGSLHSGQTLAAVDARGLEAPADWASLKSGENYVGYGRTENFLSPGGAAADLPHVYTVPVRLPLNHWALAGNWTVTEQAIVLNKADGRILYRFQARDLHLVMGPALPGKPVRFRVTVDGQQPGALHGLDIDEHGAGTVIEPRLYQLIRQGTHPIGERQFDIAFLDAGVQAFAFTFG